MIIFDKIILKSSSKSGDFKQLGTIQDTYSILETNNNDIENTRRFEINHKNMKAGGNTDVNALISITGYLNEGGNLIFNACNLGTDSRFMDELGKLTNNKFNIYYPIGFSLQHWYDSDTPGTAIYNPKALFNKNIFDEQGGYLSPLGGGENKKIETLKINSNGIQCED